MRTGKSDVYQQPIAGLSPESSWVKEDPLVEGQCVCSCDTLPSQVDRWQKRQMEAPEEQRKKRRVGGGAPCESRKTITLILFYVLVFLYSLVNRRTLQVLLVHLIDVLWTASLVNLARHTLLFRCRVPVVQ